MDLELNTLKNGKSFPNSLLLKGIQIPENTSGDNIHITDTSHLFSQDQHTNLLLSSWVMECVELVCLHLRLKGHLTVKTKQVYSCLWLNLCFSGTGVCPTYNCNYKWFCTACSRTRNMSLFQKSFIAILQSCLCLKRLYDPPWLPYCDYLLWLRCFDLLLGSASVN